MTVALSESLLRENLSEPARAAIAALHVFPEIPSTQTWLVERPPLVGAEIAATTHQTAGRGRGDRRWQQPAGAGIGVSLALCLPRVKEPLSAITLACGLEIARELRTAGARDARVKWPNDIIAAGGKLVGILTECQVQPKGVRLVVGVGLNVALPAGFELPMTDESALAPVDMKTAGGHSVPLDPNRLAALLIEALLAALPGYAEHGLAYLRDEWSDYDFLAGREVSVDTRNGEATGMASGLGEGGELMVIVDGQTLAISSGSVRLVEASHV